jgi:hypothetical protein
MQLRLEYGILLYQVGDPTYRDHGDTVFRSLREDLRNRHGVMYVPDVLRFLADPATGFRDAIKTSITVKNMSDVGRTAYGVPYGWGALEVAFRPQLFPVDRIRPGKELDCLIQFTNFGPQAVPVGTRVDR